VYLQPLCIERTHKRVRRKKRLVSQALTFVHASALVEQAAWCAVLASRGALPFYTPPPAEHHEEAPRQLPNHHRSWSNVSPQAGTYC
jgi:hypothetical protein